MQHEPKTSTKLLFTLLGLAAVFIPIILISINFQPWGFLLPDIKQETKSTPTSLPTTVTTSPTLAAEDIDSNGISILGEQEFAIQKTQPGVNLVDIRKTRSPKIAGSTILTPDQVESKIKQKTLAGTLVILISDDLLVSQQLAQILLSGGYQVGIYLPN